MDQPDTGDGQQWVPTSRKRDRQVGGRVYSSKSDSNRSNHLYIGNTHRFSQVWGISNNFSTNMLRDPTRSRQIHWDLERSLRDLVSSFRNLTRSSHVLARSSRYWPVSAWFQPFPAHFGIFCLLQVWPSPTITNWYLSRLNRLILWVDGGFGCWRPDMVGSVSGWAKTRPGATHG